MRVETKMTPFIAGGRGGRRAGRRGEECAVAPRRRPERPARWASGTDGARDDGQRDVRGADELYFKCA